MLTSSMIVLMYLGETFSGVDEQRDDLSVVFLSFLSGRGRPPFFFCCPLLYTFGQMQFG